MKKFINKLLFYLSIRKLKFQNYISYNKEIYLTKKFLQNDSRKKMIAIYDLLPHGVSVGDMIFFCFYLRYIQLKGKFIHFIIIYDKSERNKFFKTESETYAMMPFWNKKKQIWINKPSHEKFISLLENYNFKY